jgi:hypothetical protein
MNNKSYLLIKKIFFIISRIKFKNMKKESKKLDMIA